MKPEDARIDRLLAQGDLGGPHYDDIADRVLRSTAERLRRRRWALLLAPGLAAAMIVGTWRMVVHTDGGRLTPKGSPMSTSTAIGVECARGGRVCRPGDTVTFSVNSAVVSGYLEAYADRQGTPIADRIWYFPTDGGGTPFVAPGQGTIVAPEGVRIGPEHTAGRYRVTVWITARPLERSALPAADPSVIRGKASFELTIAP